MSQVWQCDRCRTMAPKPGYQRDWMAAGIDWPYESGLIQSQAQHHFCPKCTEEFREWLDLSPA